MNQTAVRTLVAGLVAARATRFVYQDVLGERLVVSHVRVLKRRLAGMVAASPDDPILRSASHGISLVEEALDCPHCAGFWITLTSTLTATHKRGLSWTSRIGLGIASSYVVGHLVDRLDSPKDDNGV